MLAPVAAAIGARADCVHVDDPDELAALRPDVVVLAENPMGEVRQRVPGTPIVWTRHGFANKRYLAQAMDHCDYACLSSDWVRDYYRGKGWRARRDEWVTGFVPMDALYQRLQSMAPRTGKTLLYAPTFNANLSSVRPLGKSWAADLRRRFPELRIVIKPHPHTAQEQPLWLARWQSWASEDPDIQVVADLDADIHALMPEADVLLTDASSVMFYFLALDRPIVLVDNPLRFDDPTRFAADGEEWAWRDIGRRIDSADGLPAAIEAALARPGEHAEARHRRATDIFGDRFDGQAAARVAEHVLALQ
jgi:CDP-glycerol glycerophosphotransferase (TagB/SpsB family)